MKTLRITYLVLLCILIALPLSAQESAMEQFMSAHSMSMLTADSIDPNHHDLVITALAMQQLTMTDQPAHPAAPHPKPSAQSAPQSCILQIDTLSGRAELLSINGQHLADVHFTLVDSTWFMWLSVDPLADKYPGNTPYMYCNGNPIRFIDPDGEAWKATFSYDTDGNSTPNGFEWIDESLSYDKDGNLKRGLYHQAIFFSENGTFSKDSKFNVGSSTATVYLADGSTKSYNACTYPSSLTSYPTIPEGVYVALVGLHQDKYLALKMRNINASKQQIELGFTNPAHPDRSYIEGANIHKAGKNNYTGIGQDGKAVSEGCFLIDRNSWDDFIGNFTCVPNTPVGIGVSRTLSEPINVNRFPAFNFILNYFFK